jgi:methionyl-tRNA formyltransferase
MTTKNKIAVFVGEDVTAHLILNQIIPSMQDAGYKPVLFVVHTPKNDKNSIPELAAHSFWEKTIPNEVIYPFIEAHNGRSNANHSPAQLAEAYKLPIFYVDDVNDPEFVERQKRARGYAGAISIRCMQIFKEPLLGMFQNKGFFLNLHPGMLPNYRGVMSVARAMEKGETSHGTTLHHVDHGIDTGPIVAQSAIPLDYHASVLINTMNLAPIGATLIERAIGDLEAGNILSGYPQVQSESDYYTFPTKKEAMTWSNAGINLIEPSELANRMAQEFSQNGTQSEFGRRLKAAINRAWNDWSNGQYPDPQGYVGKHKKTKSFKIPPADSSRALIRRMG